MKLTGEMAASVAGAKMRKAGVFHISMFLALLLWGSSSLAQENASPPSIYRDQGFTPPDEPYNPEPTETYYMEDDEWNVADTFTISPLNILLGMASLEYQRVMDEDLSIVFRGSDWSMDVSDWHFKWNSVGLGVRMYHGGKAPQGAFVSGGIDAGVLHATYTEIPELVEGQEAVDILVSSTTAVTITPSVMVGYSWLFDHFFLELGIGGAYMIGEVVLSGETFPFSGFYPFGGIYLGFGF